MFAFLKNDAYLQVTGAEICANMVPIPLSRIAGIFDKSIDFSVNNLF